MKDSSEQHEAGPYLLVEGWHREPANCICKEPSGTPDTAAAVGTAAAAAAAVGTAAASEGTAAAAAAGHEFLPTIPFRGHGCMHAAACACRVHKDGENITVNFPKEESSGLINNQLESLTFKVCRCLQRDHHHHDDGGDAMA